MRWGGMLTERQAKAKLQSSVHELTDKCEWSRAVCSTWQECIC